MARVVICDSHSAVQTALDLKISATQDLEIVGASRSVDELLSLLARQEADVLILELTLPNTVVLDLIRSLREQNEGLRIVVYTMYDEAIYGARTIRAGASGYVMKQESTERVIDAMRSVLKGEIFVSESVARQLADVDAPDDARTLLHLTNRLTDREMAVVQLLGEGSPTDAIASRLASSLPEIEELETRAAEKLGLDTRESLVQYASRLVHR